MDLVVSYMPFLLENNYLLLICEMGHQGSAAVLAVC